MRFVFEGILIFLLSCWSCFGQSPEPGRIEVVVKDEEGVPIANLPLYINLAQFVQTDTNGAINLPVAPGVYRVTVPDAAMRSQRLLATNWPSLTILSNETVSANVTVIRATRSITVIVKNQNDRPEWLASITGEGNFRGQRVSTSANTDEHGLCELAVFPGKWSISLIPDSPYSKLPVLRRVDARTNSPTVRFTTSERSKNAVIQGIAVNESGSPIPNLFGSIRAPTATRSLSLTTDRNGYFSLGLSEGAYLIGGETSYMAPSDLVFAHAGRTNVLALTLRRGQSLLNLHVLAPDGTEATNVYAQMSAEKDGQRYRTFEYPTPLIFQVFEALWTITLRNPPPGARLEQPRVVNLSAQSSNNVTIQLPSINPTGTVRGRVTFEDGEPIDNVQISASDALGNLLRTNSGPDGSFTLPVFGATWNVTVEKHVGSNWFAVYRQLAVADGEDIDLRTVKIPLAGSTLTLRLLGPDGVPVDVTENPTPIIEATATRATNGEILTKSAQIVGSDWVFDISPGKWELVLPSTYLNKLGFSSVLPIDVTVATGASDYVLRLETLPEQSTPPLLQADLRMDGAPRLKAVATTGEQVYVLGSDDLKEWNWLPNLYGAKGDLSLMPTNQHLFYRAGIEE
jgi:hypothetical protein